jgi:hypothetical protein
MIRVNDRGESDLAWELAEAVAARLPDRDRTRVYVNIGAGHPYTAIVTLLEAAVAGNLAVSPEVADRLTDWLDRYAHNDDAPRLHQLLDAVRAFDPAGKPNIRYRCNGSRPAAASAAPTPSHAISASVNSAKIGSSETTGTGGGSLAAAAADAISTLCTFIRDNPSSRAISRTENPSVRNARIPCSTNTSSHPAKQNQAVPRGRDYCPTP